MQFYLRVFLCVGLTFVFQGCADSKPAADKIISTETIEGNKTVTYESGLKVTDIKLGTGALTARIGDTLTLHYTGTFKDGVKFDSSHDRNDPIEFRLGISPIIEGWKRGLQGMKAGGVRKLVVPSKLAYAEKGDQSGVVPPNTDLTFVVELLKVNGEQ